MGNTHSMNKNDTLLRYQPLTPRQILFYAVGGLQAVGMGGTAITFFLTDGWTDPNTRLARGWSPPSTTRSMSGYCTKKLVGVVGHNVFLNDLPGR